VSFRGFRGQKSLTLHYPCSSVQSVAKKFLHSILPHSIHKNPCRTRTNTKKKMRVWRWEGVIRLRGRPMYLPWIFCLYII